MVNVDPALGQDMDLSGKEFRPAIKILLVAEASGLVAVVAPFQTAFLKTIAEYYGTDSVKPLNFREQGDMAALQSAAPSQPEGEGAPIAGSATPMLTWLGEKLQPGWAARRCPHRSPAIPAAPAPLPSIPAALPNAAVNDGRRANPCASRRSPICMWAAMTLPRITGWTRGPR